jgi:uncharacterized protein (TIGR00375 family)
MYIADFHIHSKYSRATSSEMDLEHLDEWAKIKGINILGTGDFTHPDWFRELKSKLIPLGNGLYRLQASKASQKITNFILTTEISCIYSQGGKARRIHILIFAPDLETVEKINTRLSWIGNLKSDGRPILGLSAKELTKLVLEISPDCLIVPSHIWTPWFSLFGSESGFDSLEECFEELSSEIYALETGLSSDPPMNWRLSKLNKYTLISNSDAHSLTNLGREANVFKFEKLSYNTIIEAIKNRNQGNLLYTIEFFPEEGKYHFDGHRLCGVRLSPEETKKVKGICPKCKKRVTIGVMNRVDSLADQPKPIKPAGAPGYKSLIPLREIIAEALNLTKGAGGVESEYQNLVSKGGSEFNILLNLSYEELEKFTSQKIVEGIKRVREEKVKILAGYDGAYGKIKIFAEETARQEKLF